MKQDTGTAQADEGWEQRKRASVAQLIFRCARLLNEQAMERARAKHGVAAKTSHTQLFPHIPLEPPGIRITELASRVGISKQAVGQLVDELEALGAVRREVDPQDKRARCVVFTNEGRQGLSDGMKILEELEAELEAELGRARMRALHDALLAMNDVL